MATRTAVFVLGMHRSGTSALARVLNLLGAALPRRVLPAGLGNELGHWEPEAAVALHDRLLAAAGTTVNGLSGPAESWFATSAATAFLAPMRDLIRDDFAEEPLFVFKDPRSALVFPLWRQVMTELGIRCLPIVVLRNPAEVARSLADRQAKAEPGQGWSMDRGGLLWLRYVLAAERHTRGATRAFCAFPDLLADWQGVSRRLATGLDLTWPRSLAAAGPDIEGFLDATHRHHHADQPLAARGGIWSTWIDPSFNALQRACAGAEPDQAVLDSVGRSFTDACAAIQPVREPDAPRQPVTADAPARPGQRGHPASRRLGLVVTAFMLEATWLPLLAAILDAATEAGAGVTIFPVGTFPAASGQALALLVARPGVDSEPCTRSTLPIEPAFMCDTVALFRQLRGQALDVVLFPDREGLAHASVVAKLTGLAFATTTLGVLACGGLRRQREQDRRFPDNLVTLSVEHIEQQAVENADLVLLPSAAVAQWMRDAGWRLRTGPPLPEGMSGPAITSAVVGALRRPADAVAHHAVDLPPSPDVTVIITHFEQPHLLDQNLQALVQQTDRDFTVLVVDDGSQGAEALRYLAGVEAAYRQLRLRLIRQPNRYLGAARNAGIRAATTACVILLDDDNLAFPSMVASLKQAVRLSGADVVTCGIRHFHDAARPPQAAPAGHGPDQVFAAGPVLVGAVHNCFGDASGIYRRAVFDRVGYFHEQRGVTFEDWQMHLRVIAAGCRLLSLPEPLVWYRVRGDSMLRTTHRYDNARVIAAAFHRLPQAMVEPLTDFLVGLEAEQARLHETVTAISAVAAASTASQADMAADAARQLRALEQMVAARSAGAQTAERYAQSLEQALAEANRSCAEAATYARSLEQARAAAEAYARHLEGELAKAIAAGSGRRPAG